MCLFVCLFMCVCVCVQCAYMCLCTCVRERGEVNCVYEGKKYCVVWTGRGEVCVCWGGGGGGGCLCERGRA